MARRHQHRDPDGGGADHHPDPQRRDLLGRQVGDRRPALERVLRADLHLGVDPETPVEQPTGATTAREILISGYILNRVSKKFVKAVLERLLFGLLASAPASS